MGAFLFALRTWFVADQSSSLTEHEKSLPRTIASRFNETLTIEVAVTAFCAVRAERSAANFSHSESVNSVEREVILSKREEMGVNTEVTDHRFTQT